MRKSIDGILGLVIGDALGVPNEFESRECLQENPVIEMIGYKAHDVPAGTWSDDSAMTLATIDSIVKKGIIDVNDIADKFCLWWENAEYTATNVVFDIGGATRKAIFNYMKNKLVKTNILASDFGGNSYYDNGNGSLMRILPIAYYAYYKKLNKEELLEVVRKTSSITHAHEISIMACYIYCLIAISLLDGKSIKESYVAMRKENYLMFENETIENFDRIINYNIGDYKLDQIKSSGFVIDTLEASLWCLLNNSNYNDTIIQAINLGEDTDTVGAVTGGLAGIYYGVSKIKESWKNDLIRKDYIEELCDKFDKILAK